MFHSVSDPVVRMMVNEWRPLTTGIVADWHAWKGTVFTDFPPILLFAAFVGSVALAPSLEDAPMLAVAGFFIAAAFLVARNIALAVLAITIPLAHHSALALKQRGFSAQVDENLNSKIISIAAIALVVVSQGMFLGRLPAWDRVPVGALAFMARGRLHGNILNNYDWGTYLIWHLTPQSRVFIDGRAELVYPDSVLLDFADFSIGGQKAEGVIKKYPHDFVLVDPVSKAAGMMSRQKEWKLIYEDKVAALYARNSAPAATVIHRVSKHEGFHRDYFP